MTLSLMTLHIYNNIHIACRYTISNINRYLIFIDKNCFYY